MLRNKLFIGIVGISSIVALAAQDPVLMTINNKDIKLSEFEYLYHKNNQQQITQEPLDKYVDRFVTYKMKVADAEAAGIDTLGSFKKEFDGYRNELAKPYLVDESVNQRLAHEAYERMKTDVDVSHIMIELGDTPVLREKQKAKLDSIRKKILSGESFEDLALKYSIDPSVKRNKGHLGFITPGRLPYSFEKVAYSTPEGKISEVFATNYGFHIVKVIASRPNRGTVRVEHIMKRFAKNPTSDAKSKLHTTIDSIYNLVKNGESFEDLAKKYSDDKGSAASGGVLPWFGTGEMIPEFEAVAYKLKDGEVSEPFETAFGVHIMKKLESKPLQPYESVEKQLLNSINNDERSLEAKHEKVAQLKKEYKFKTNKGFKSYIKKALDECGGYDSIFISKISKSSYPMFTYANGQVTPSSRIVSYINPTSKLDANRGMEYVMDQLGDAASGEVLAYEKKNLVNKYPDYRNLLNEYRDGMLLFEISNRNVWDKASSDTKGLEVYFQQHKSDYKWDTPRFKGTIVYVTNDSVYKGVQKSLNKMSADTAITGLRKAFSRNIKIENLVVAKGENPQVDELIFNGEKKAPSDGRFTKYFILKGSKIDQPEEASDVKGLVVSDYQNELEAQWIKDLKNRYKVNINESVMKTVK